MKISPLAYSYVPNTQPAQADPTTSSNESSDTVTLTWSDNHTSAAIKGTLGAATGTLLGTIPVWGPVIGLASTTISAGVGVGLKAAQLGEGLPTALFRSQSNQEAWRAPMKVIVGLTAGLAAIAAAGLIAWQLMPSTSDQMLTFARGNTMLLGAIGGAMSGMMLPNPTN